MNTSGRKIGVVKILEKVRKSPIHENKKQKIRSIENNFNNT